MREVEGHLHKICAYLCSINRFNGVWNWVGKKVLFCSRSTRLLYCYTSEQQLLRFTDRNSTGFAFVLGRFMEVLGVIFAAVVFFGGGF